MLALISDMQDFDIKTSIPTYSLLPDIDRFNNASLAITSS